MATARWKKVLSVLGVGTAGVIGVAGLAFVAGGVWLHTQSGQQWLAGQIDAAVDGAMEEGDFQLGGLEVARGYTRLSLRQVQLNDGTGRPVVQLDTIDIHLKPWALLAGKVYIDQAVADGVILDLQADDQGVFDLQRMFPPSDEPQPPWEGLPVDIVAPDIQFNNASLSVTPAGPPSRFDEASIHFGVRGEGKRIAIEHLEIDGKASIPGMEGVVVHSQGNIVYTGDDVQMSRVSVEAAGNQVVVDGLVGLDKGNLNLAIAVPRLDVASLDPLAGDIGLQGAFQGTFETTGTFADVHIGGLITGIEGTGGAVNMQGNAKLDGPRPMWSMRAEIVDFKSTDVYPDTTEALVRGTLDLQGEGSSWPHDVKVVGRYVASDTQVVSGIDLDDLDAKFQIQDGRLVLDRIGVDAVAGQFETTGTIDLVSGPIALHIRGPVQAWKLRKMGVKGIGGEGFIDVKIDGDPKSGKPFSGAGSLVMTPMTYQKDVRFAKGVVNYRFRFTPPKQLVADLDFTGFGAKLYGTEFARVRADTVHVEMDNDGNLALNGKVATSAGTWGEIFATDKVNVNFDVDVPAKGALAVDARVVSQDYQALDFVGTRAIVEAQVRGDEVGFMVFARNGDRRQLRTRGFFDQKRGRVTMQNLEASPTPRILWTNEGPQSFSLSKGGIADASVSMVSTLGALQVTGDLGTDGDIDGKIAAQNVQLDMIAELFPDRASGMSGSLDLEVNLLGNAHAPTVTGALNAKGVWAADTARWLDASGTFSNEDGNGLATDMAIGVAGEPLAQLTGVLPVDMDLRGPKLDPDGNIDLAFVVRPGRLERVERLVKGLTLPAGSLSARLDVHGPLRNPDFELAGVASMDVPGWRNEGRAEFKLVREGQEIQARADLREGFAGRAMVAASGTTQLDKIFDHAVAGGPKPDMADYGLFLDDMDVNGQLIRMPLTSLMSVSGTRVAAEGYLDGVVHATGSPFGPIVTADVNWRDAKIGDMGVDDAYVRLTPADTGYAVDIGARFLDEDGAQSGQLSLAGDVPVEVDIREAKETWARGKLDLKLDGDIPLALASALPTGVEEADGVLQVAGEFRGDPFDPKVNLETGIEGGTMAIRSVGLRLTDIDLKLDASQRAVTLDHFEAKTAPLRRLRGLETGEQDSRVRVSGKVKLEDWAPKRLKDGRVELGNAWVMGLPDLQARVGGDLTVKGEWPKIKIRNAERGEPLRVSHAHVFRDAASFLEAAPLSLDRSVRVVRQGERVRTPKKEPEPSIIDDLDIDIKVLLQRNMNLDVIMPMNDMLGGLGAAITSANVTTRVGSEEPLRVLMKDGITEIRGTVNVLEGKVRVVQAQFELSDQSSVSWTGGDVADPLLNIVGTMQAGSAEIGLRLEGTPSDPGAPEFTSDEYDETQILLMLLTGRPPDEMDNNQGMQALSALALSSLLANAQLGSLQIEPDGKVQFGANLTQTVFVKWAYNPKPDLTDNGVAIGAEWAVMPRLVLESGLGNRYKWSDTYWQYKF